MQNIICMSNTQPMHTTSMHLGTRSSYGTRVRVLKENATHLSRITRLQNRYSKVTRLHKHGTNHKSLQVHEKNSKNLQKQHGYKYKVQNKLNRNYINFNQCITRFKHKIKNIFTKSLNQTINQSIANP